MIEIRNLKKSFGSNLIFKDVNLNIERGDCVVVIGPSGCGKSTLLRCINNMEKPDSGEIYFDGQNTLAKGVKIDALRTRLGMVYQNFNLFSHLNVMENVILAPRCVSKLSKEAAIEKADEILKKVGMENRRYFMPSQLSGGQKQRVAIARCLAMNPEAILFDEPTSALDPTMVDEVESVIRTLAKSGMTSVIVTHEMGFAKSIATKVVYMDECGIYETGTPEEIFEHPTRPKTRAFVDKLKTWERVCEKDSFDLYELMSDVRSYCVTYGFTARQMDAIDHICEEIVYTHVKNGHKAVFSLRCSGRSEFKDVSISFPGLDCDPISDDTVDPLGIKLISGLTDELHSKQTDGVWSVTASIKSDKQRN